MPKENAQLNLKLDKQRYAVLEAATFVRGHASLRDLVMPTVDALIDELEGDEAVSLALRARSQHEAREKGVLKELRPREG